MSPPLGDILEMRPSSLPQPTSGQLSPKNGPMNDYAVNNPWRRIPLPEIDPVECFIQEEEALPSSAVIGMLDMDGFEIQIYLKKRMGVEKGREMYLATPCILADPTTDRIIAVNFLAKAKGISRRDDRVAGAKEKCPEVFVIRKDVRFDKPENINLRHSSWEVLDSILKFREEKEMKFTVEYASNDEYYLDLTHQVDCLMANTPFMEGLAKGEIGKRIFMENSVYSAESLEIIEKFHELRILIKEGRKTEPGSHQLLRLILGSTILQQIRNYVFFHTNFEGSGGIGANKLLAKFATPLHKPGGITILPQSALLRVSADIPVEKIPSLGGERGKLLKGLIRGQEDQAGQQDKQQELKGQNPAAAEVTVQAIQEVTVQELAILPLHKIVMASAPPGTISFGEMLILRKRAQGITNDPVVEKLMKMTAMVGRSNLQGLRFHNSRRIYEVIHILVAELMERLEEEENRHKRIPEYIQFGLSYIVFPRKEEDRGKPPEMTSFGYSFDPSSSKTLIASSKELVNVVVEDVMQTVQGKSGVIVKTNFAIKAFRGVV